MKPSDPLTFIEQKLGAMKLDAYEIYRTENRTFSVEAKEGKIDALEEALERGVAIRLFQGGRVGFASSSGWETPFLEKVIDLAYGSLKILDEGARWTLPTSSPSRGTKRGSVKGLKKERGLELSLLLERSARDYDRRITRVRDASYASEVRSVTLKNSRGLEISDTRERHELSVMVVAEGEGGHEMAWESDFASSANQLDAKKVGEEAAERAISQLGARPIATGKWPVVLDPVVAASFLGVVSNSFLGDQVQKNRSSLRDRLGEGIYSKKVTMKDDGSLLDGYSTADFDGEGVSMEPHDLVSCGTLKQFLYDTFWATKAGKQSTGNAIRSGFKEPPRVGPTNFFIEAGEGSREDLFSDLEKGLWVRDVIGVHTADVVTGDFSLGASGLWIEGGKRKFPVRGVTISGNLHQLFREVVRVGAEPRFYHSFGSPPLLVSSLDIGGL